MPGSQGALDIFDALDLFTGSLATWQGIVLLGTAFFLLVVSSGRVCNCQRGDKLNVSSCLRCSGSSGEALQVLALSASDEVNFLAEAPPDSPDTRGF